MFAKQVAGVGPVSRTPRFSRKTSMLLPLAILLPCGILHATPILNPGEFQLQNQKQIKGYTAVAKSARDNAGLAGTGMAPKPESIVESSPQLAGSGCILASNCSNPVDVPEPQSLVLVGAGLLSMAGVIRRRLAQELMHR